MSQTKYRNGLFETNSSSAHAFMRKKKSHVLTKEELQGQIWLRDDGTLYLWEVEYGFDRSFQVLTSFTEKLSYVICEYCGDYYGDDPKRAEILDSILNQVKEILPEVTAFGLHEKQMDIYLDESGNEILHKNLTYDGYDKENDCNIYTYKDANGETKTATRDEEHVYFVEDIGMIDHQSDGKLKGYLEKNNISIKEFLTDTKYIIICDGDERDDLDKMLDAQIINLDEIEEIVR